MVKLLSKDASLIGLSKRVKEEIKASKARETRQRQGTEIPQTKITEGLRGPPPERVVDSEVTPAKGVPGTVFKDAETGRLKGIVNPEGRVLLNLEEAEVRALAQKFARRQQLPFGTQEAQTVQAQQQAEAEQAALGEQVPERRELDLEEVGEGQLEKIPIIGGIAASFANVLFQMDKNRVGRGERALFDETLDKSVLQPQELRDKALSMVEKEVFDQGISGADAFGVFIEGIPVIGSLANTYGAGLLELPSENIETMKTEIQKVRTKASKYESWTRRSDLDPAILEGYIRKSELNLQRLESRIKMLSNFSSSLRFDSDQINVIETEILTARESLLESRSRLIARRGQGSIPATEAILAEFLTDLEETQGEGLGEDLST